MNLIAIDTSSPVLTVALQKNGGEIRESALEGFLSHAENLLPMMDHLLKDENLKIQDVDTFLIGRGPGSFTGLRIGFSTLKSLLTLQTADCYGAESLDIIAGRVPTANESELAVCLDARRNMLYLKQFKATPEGWSATGKTQVLTFEETLELLPENILMTGDALERYQNRFSKTDKKIRFLSKEEWYPRATVLINWFHQGKSTPLVKLTEPIDFVPLYYRRSEAEEKIDNVHHS